MKNQQTSYLLIIRYFKIKLQKTFVKLYFLVARNIFIVIFAIGYLKRLR